MVRQFLLLVVVWLMVGNARLVSQCTTCGNATVDVGETNLNCPQDVAHSATCTSPCSRPTSFESTVGIRQAFDFSGSTTWSTAGLPAGWTFAGAPTPTSAGALPAADAYGAKAGLIQPNCSGSCTGTNGFCIGNLASSSSVFAGGTGGKLGANFDGRPNVASNISYAVLRGQLSPTLVSPTFDMSAVEGFKVQFWLFPSESSCGQLNSWGSCTGNVAFLDFSANGGTTWNQMLTINLSSTSSDMCFNNSTNTLWLSEGSWSRVCLTVFKNSTSPGNFYPAAGSGTSASGMVVNNSFFTASFKFRVRYSQTASCTSGITTTNPGRYLAIDYPVITSGNEMIPCGISFANMCGYGADNNDDGVGSSTLTTNVVAHGTVRRSVNQAERGVEILTSQTGTYSSQNLSGGTFASDFDLCNAEGGDKQCINWQSNNNFYTAVYECITDWEAASGTGINLQYYEGTTPQSVGMTKVTSAGETALIGWRYLASRFVGCGSTSDLNAGCNGYSFVSGSLPTQFARGFYRLATNSSGQAWSSYGASSCSHYFNGPFFAPISIPDTVTGSGNYIFCTAGNDLVFTGLSKFCQDGSGMSGSGTITVTGPGGFSETITSGGQGSTPITTAGTYTVTANTPSTPTQCVNCSRSVCITVTASDISNCTEPLPIPGMQFWSKVLEGDNVELHWKLVTGQPYAQVSLEKEDPIMGFVAMNDWDGGLEGVWVDRKPGIGRNFYRLKAVDAENQVHWSESLEVMVEGRGDISLWPQPASEYAWLRVEAPFQKAQVTLTDLQGRILRAWTVSQEESRLDLEGISAGSYFVSVRLEQGLFTKRLVKE